MDFDDIEKDSVERETTFYVNTVIGTATVTPAPDPPETEQQAKSEKAKNEGIYEQLRTDRQLHDRKPDEQDGTDGRIKRLIYIILALVVVLYVTVIVLIIVVVVPKEQDGGWTNWETWNPCSESCGGGILSRNRACSNPAPVGMGKQCIGNSEQVELCNKQPCPGTDGGWSNWESWNTCSASCGGGITSRNRSCSNPAPIGMGMQCIGNFDQVELCKKQPCPGTDGGWSNWESWNTCSASCGGGITSRNRSCSNPAPIGMGMQCIGNFDQVELCKKQPCPGTDGGWSNWESWNTCSASCGGGITSRNRSCSNPAPIGMGMQCIGNFDQVELCKKQPCPGTDGGWSVWESWGTCSHSCGGGVRSRSRSCTTPSPSLTGRPCTGDFTDISVCKRTTCPKYNVAFTAYSLNTTSTSWTTLQFRGVHLNNGNAYNTTTGKFTCNVPGVYHFVVTLTKAYKDIGYTSVYLRVNSSNKLALFYNPDDDNSNEVGTSIITGAGSFRLSKNDVVDVYGRPNYFFNSVYSSITGFLITPDQ